MQLPRVQPSYSSPCLFALQQSKSRQPARRPRHKSLTSQGHLEVTEIGAGFALRNRFLSL